MPDSSMDASGIPTQGARHRRAARYAANYDSQPQQASSASAPPQPFQLPQGMPQQVPVQPPTQQIAAPPPPPLPPADAQPAPYRRGRGAQQRMQAEQAAQSQLHPAAFSPASVPPSPAMPVRPSQSGMMNWPMDLHAGQMVQPGVMGAPSTAIPPQPGAASAIPGMQSSQHPARQGMMGPHGPQGGMVPSAIPQQAYEQPYPGTPGAYTPSSQLPRQDVYPSHASAQNPAFYQTPPQTQANRPQNLSNTWNSSYQPERTGYLMGSGEVPIWASASSSASGGEPKRASSLRLPEIKVPNIKLSPKAITILVSVLAAAILILGLASAISSSIQRRAYEALVAEVTAYDGRYCQGVYVDGIHLGGLNQQEAYDRISAQARERNESWFVKLTYQGQVLTELRSEHLGMVVDVNEALLDAWAAGHTGSYEERKKAMDLLTMQPYHASSSEPVGDTSVIDGILSTLSTQLYKPAQDAALLSFNAQLTDPFEFLHEEAGYQLNAEGLKQQLYHMVDTMQTGSVEIELMEIQPTVTVEQLKATQYAVRSVATTEISTKSDDNRNNNIRRAFALISGTVIQPNSTFSFNNVVGERTTKNGFYPAPEYVNGQVETGIGGGVCQASTTVYQAAIYAGLNILARTPHSMEVNYSDYGKDATVYWKSNHTIDLIFQNITTSPLYIKAAVESNPNNKSRLITKVTIYGQPLEPGVKYDFRTVEEVIPAPVEPEIRQDTEGVYVTFTDEEPYEYQAAKNGMKITSYRCKFVKGEEVERVYLALDTIKPKSQILYMGVTVRPLDLDMLPPL